MKIRPQLLLVTLKSLFALLLLFPSHTQAQGGANNRTLSAGSQNRWGVKTNLIYDVVDYVNLGVEGSLGSHWGVSLEALAPWFSSDDKLHTTQVMALGGEARYYWRGWSDPEHHLSGPFWGLHAMGGIYDICIKGKGAQGDYFAMGGVVLGYTAWLEKWWRVNLSIGMGGLYTPYVHYHILPKEYYGPQPVNHYSGAYTYFGPTKVELSVVWLFSQCWQNKN